MMRFIVMFVLAALLPASALAQTTLTPMRIAMLGFADGSAEPLFAQGAGIFKKYGIDATVTSYNGGGAVIAAVAGGSLEAGFSNAVSAAQAIERGIPIIALTPAAEYPAQKSDTLLVKARGSKLKTAADLNGQVVAVNGLRDLTQYEMQAWIDQNGGDVKSVKLIEIPFSEMGVALETGRVAAAISAEPFTTGALTQARIIGNASESVGKHYMVTGWFSTTSWLAKNAETAKRLQVVMQKIARWANANHADTQAIILKYTKIAPEVAGKMVRSQYGETKADVALLQPVLDLAVKYGGMQPVAAADLIWQG